VNWTESGTEVSASATYSFTATQARTLVANFSLNNYTISASVSPVSSGSISGAGNYNHGATVTMIATPEVGYTFVNWTESGTEVSASATYSFTATQARTLVANFELKQYLITLEANPENGGTVNFAAQLFTHGTEVTIIATPNSENFYLFVNWSENGETIEGAEATYTFTALSDKNFMANFALENQHNVSISRNPVSGGTVTGGGSYFANEEVTILATPNTGYAFSGWTGYTVTGQNPYTFTMPDQTVNFTANFSRISYTIVASAGTGGTITPQGNVSVYHGENQTFTITPNPGYSITDVIVDGESQGAITEYQFVGVVENHEISAQFTLNTYSISATVNPENAGSIQGLGNGQFEHGESVELVAVPATGYSFVSWTEGVETVSDNPTYSFTATSDRILVANFESIDYIVAAVVNPVGAGTIEGTGVYNFGDDVTLTATANTGYQFVNWTDSENEIVGTQLTYSFNMPAENVTVTANFEIIGYTVAAVVNPVGAGTVEGTGVYNFGDAVTLTATTNTGYQFVNWTDSESQVLGTELTYGFNMPAENVAVNANFEIIGYTVAAVVNPVGAGTIEGTGVYNFGDAVTLTATANIGYQFVNWTDSENEIVGTELTYGFNMPAENVTVNANFEIIGYTVAAVVNPIGAGTIEGTGVYNFGDAVTLTATANTGYQFVNWTDSESQVLGTELTYAFDMPAGNVTVTANFEIIGYTVAAVVNPVGAGTVEGTGVYNFGDAVTLTATTNTGYQFVNWTDSESQVLGTELTYAFDMPAEKVAVNANFEIIGYTVAAVVNPVGAGTVEGTGVYNFGDAVTLTATANIGYQFVNWTNSENQILGTQLTYGFNMPAGNVTVTANFEIIGYTVAAVVNPVGAGTIEGTGVYNFGDAVTLTATANIGYQFVNWTDSESQVLGTELTYAFDMPAGNVTVTANFEIVGYTVAAVVNPIGAGTIEGTGVYNFGDAVTLTATANTGYQFVNWTDSESQVLGTELTYGFNMPAENVTVTANFRALVSASINPTSGTLYESEPENLETIITWNDASAVVSIVAEMDGELFELTEGEDYTITDIDGTTALLTFITSDGKFVSDLLKGESDIVCTINFDFGDAAMYTIHYVYVDLYYVSFVVQDIGNNTIEGATITFNGIVLGEGVYDVGLVEAGSYEYSVSKPGYITSSGTLDVIDQDIEQVVVLELINEFTVTFSLSSSGTPVQGALISIHGQELVSNADGIATIVLANGTYLFVVTKDGYDEIQSQLVVAGLDKLVEIEMTTGISTLTDVSVQIYPNPATDWIHILRNDENPATLEIYTDNGKLVRTESWTMRELVLNIQELKPGLYLIRISGGNTPETIRFIKQ
jgi:uncharacterized repeat protein (TIGR02543 family)